MNISITAEDFESAAMPHLNDLFRAARRIIGNQTEAEDAVQETYYQAWKSFHRFELGTNCRAWLFKILFHVINHQRRKVWRWSLFADVEEAPCSTPTYEPPGAAGFDRRRGFAGLREDTAALSRGGAAGRRAGVLLQRDRQHAGHPRRHGDVPAQPGAKVVARGVGRGSRRLRNSD